MSWSPGITLLCGIKNIYFISLLRFIFRQKAFLINMLLKNICIFLTRRDIAIECNFRIAPFGYKTMSTKLRVVIHSKIYDFSFSLQLNF